MRTARRLALAFLCAASLKAAASSGDVEILRPYLQPERVNRFAIVISVEDYLPEIGTVENARGDAIAVGEALAAAGFQVTSVDEPKTKIDILNAVQQVAQNANPAETPAVITIFFAGHGFQAKGYNYIVPALARRSSIISDSLAVSHLLKEVSPKVSGISLVILDSCRTKIPLHGENSVGFAQSDKVPNVVMALAADYGQSAQSSYRLSNTADSKGSPYSSAMSTFLRQANPPMNLSETLDKVRNRVREWTRIDEKTMGQQPVEVSGGMPSRFWMMPNPDNLALEAADWKALQESPKLKAGCIREFVGWYPGGNYNKAALILLNFVLQSSGDEKCE